MGSTGACGACGLGPPSLSIVDRLDLARFDILVVPDDDDVPKMTGLRKSCRYSFRRFLGRMLWVWDVGGRKLDNLEWSSRVVTRTGNAGFVCF